MLTVPLITIRDTDIPYSRHPPLLLTCRQIYYEAIAIYCLENCFLLHGRRIPDGILAPLRQITQNHGINFNSLFIWHPQLTCSVEFLEVKLEPDGVVVNWVREKMSRRDSKALDFSLALRVPVCLCKLRNTRQRYSSILGFLRAYDSQFLWEEGVGQRIAQCRQFWKANLFNIDGTPTKD